MTTHLAQIILYTICILYIFCTVSYYICAIKKKDDESSTSTLAFLNFHITYQSVFTDNLYDSTANFSGAENTKTLLVKYII